MRRINVDRRVMMAGLGGAVAGSLLVGRSYAGELNPPPGPPSPTGIKLDQIAERSSRTPVGVAQPCMPVQSVPSSSTALHSITESGSYYLVRNLHGQQGLHGIEVLADNVDIDLFGFHVYGPPPDPLGTATCAITSSSSNVTVYDGSLIGWTIGVDFSSASLFILWDVASVGAEAVAFALGSRGQVYDCDASNAPVAFRSAGVRTLVHECGAWTCPTGFSCFGTQNLFLSNCATECATPFDIGPGNAYGPIVSVSGVGDISLVPGGSHPDSNLIY